MEKLYLDLETHEVVSASIIFERELLDRTGKESKFEWLKIYPSQLARLPDVIESPAYRVAHEVLFNVQKADNIYPGSFEDISKAVGVPRITVARVMKKLQDADYIRAVKKGSYMVNPTKICAGDKAKQYVLKEKYFALKAPIRMPIKTIKEQSNGNLANTVESLIQGGCNHEQ